MNSQTTAQQALESAGPQIAPAPLPGESADTFDVQKVWLLTRAATDGTLVAHPTEMPDQQAREALGTTLVPELVSGKYETAFRDACWDSTRNRAVRCEPNYLAWQLGGYAGPPTQRGPLPLKLVNHDA